MNIYIILLALCLIFFSGFIIKKEYFESNTEFDKEGQRYSVSEISRAVYTLMQSLSDNYSLVRVHSVYKNSPYLEFHAMMYNIDRPSIRNFYAKVKIPLSSKGAYSLESSRVSDSDEMIENGVYKMQDSQKFKALNK